MMLTTPPRQAGQLGAAGRTPAHPLPSAMTWLRGARAASPALWWTSLLMLAASIVTAALAAFDPRLIQGVSVWLKPGKFQVSTGLYLLTLAMVLALLPREARKPRAVRYVAWASVAGAVFEVVYITWRASRGEASHFNISSPGAIAMYSLMGVGAVVLVSTSGVLGALVWRARSFAYGDTLRRGIALGLLIGCVLGAISGAIMSSQANHWVGGAPTDAGGLPLFNWSRDGGDWRVAHFFGLHAMQVIPVWAWMAQRVATPLPAWRTTWVFAAAYALLVVFTFLQAASGYPLWR